MKQYFLSGAVPKGHRGEFVVRLFVCSLAEYVGNRQSDEGNGRFFLSSREGSPTGSIRVSVDRPEMENQITAHITMT